MTLQPVTYRAGIPSDLAGSLDGLDPKQNPRIHPGSINAFCETPGCSNPAAVQDHRYWSASGSLVVYRKRLRHCWRCRSAKLRERHPATYVLNAIRNRARKRKLPFSITLSEFKDWCQRTGYLERRGRKGDSLSIGRIDHDLGYSIGNIQTEPYLENCVKGHGPNGQNARREPDPF
jgi:hypothetical protein